MPGDGGGELSGKGVRVELPEAPRRQLGASGQQLETCAVVEGERNLLVLVYRAEYGGGVPPARPPRVVRFSRSEHSIRVTPRIVLSSPHYYRDLEEQSAPPGEQAQARRRGIPAPSAKRVLPALGIGWRRGIRNDTNSTSSTAGSLLRW